MQSPTPALAGKRELVHLGASAQHPAREEGIVGVGLKGDNPVGDVGEGIGIDTLVGAYVNGRAAARHQRGQHGELRLARAGLLRNAPAVEARRRKQHREPFAKRQRHRGIPSVHGACRAMSLNIRARSADIEAFVISNLPFRLRGSLLSAVSRGRLPYP
jgi:hypothetical protein